MPHHHGRSHVVRRHDSEHQLQYEHVSHAQWQQDGHANRDNRERDDAATVLSVVYKTLPNTYTGAVVWVTQDPNTMAGDPVEQTADDSEPTSTAKTYKSAAATTTADDSSTAQATSAASTSRHVQSTLEVATSSPTPTAAATTAIAVASASAATSASASPTAAAASSGMSGGAKAGLAFGILIALAAILAVVLLLYRRKRRAMEAQKADDEKTAMQAMQALPPAEREPSVRTARTMSTAPRLSLRPVTQFLPTLENRKSGGNLLNLAAATAPAAAAAASSREPATADAPPPSPWERRGAANAQAGAAANPFNDPQPSSPAQNPFGNHAATETPLATTPSTPQFANHSSAPSGSSTLNDFANPAPAIAAAEAVPIAVAAGAITRKEVPAHKKNPSPEGSTVPPPAHRSAPSDASSIPPNSAQSSNFPASPGPAPSGPLPIAANRNGPGAAPGPNNVHRVQLDFKPSMNDELELRAGQLVRMLHEYDDGWALCIRMDRSQQGVVPRTCVSKHPVKPRNSPPPRGPPPHVRSPPMGPMRPGVPQPRPLSPASGRSSPHPPALSPANGRMSPGPRSMSPGPNQRPMSPNMGPQGRARSKSNAPYAGAPRSMSPGPYGGGPHNGLPSPKMPRPRSNSASQVMAKRASPPLLSPLNPNANSNANANTNAPMPSRKPVPGMAM